MDDERRVDVDADAGAEACASAKERRSREGRDRTRRARLVFALALLLLVAGCSKAPAGVALTEWTYEGDDGRRAALTLPVHIAGSLVPRRDSTYTLTSRVELPPRLRGRPLELTIPVLSAPIALFVDGEAAPPLADVMGAGYRATRPHRFRIPASASADGALDLRVRVTNTWTQAAWLDAIPSLGLVDEPSSVAALVDAMNHDAAIGALVGLIQVACTCLLVYAADRKRRAYLWFGVQTAMAAAYPAFFLGVLSTVVGRYDILVVVVALALALWVSLYFTHAYFELPRAPRALVALLISAIAIAVAFPGPFDVPRIGVPVIAVSISVVILYQLATALAILRSRTTSRWRRQSSLWLLLAWLALGSSAWPDVVAWCGGGDLAGGARFGSFGLIFFGFFLSLLLSWNHGALLARSDSQNDALKGQLDQLGRRQAENERLSDELRRQVALRSEQLFTALSVVATGASGSFPAVGDTLSGRYLLERELGQGGMGTVYRALRLSDGQALAIKLSKETDGRTLARLAREAHIASLIRDPCVVEMIDVDFTEKGRLYFVMELLEGGSLREHRREFADPARGAPVLLQIARGLEALHAAGIVHRDIKPANVLFARRGDEPIVKITDLGISRPFLSGDAGNDADGAPISEAARDGEADSAAAPEPSESASMKSVSARPSAPAVAPLPEDEEDSAANTAIIEPPADARAPSEEASRTARRGAASTTAPGRRVTGSSSKTWSSSDLTKPGRMAGTPMYMAPESITPEGALDAKVDIFSLGVLAYELFSGTAPFADPPSSLALAGLPIPKPASLDRRAPSVGPELTALVMACLSLDPAERPDAKSLVAALAALPPPVPSAPP